MIVDPQHLLAQIDIVRALARRLLADDHEANDVAQQVWLKAHRREPGEGVPHASWLATIARNVIRSRARGEVRRRLREERAAQRECLPSAAELFEQEALRRHVVDALFALAEPYRTTIALRFFEERSYRDIARLMQVSIETVRTRIKRGLTQLRERLSRELHEWRHALIPLAYPAGGMLTAAISGVLVMKSLATLAVAIILALGWFWWTHETPPRNTSPAPSVATAAKDAIDTAPEQLSANRSAEAASRSQVTVRTPRVFGRVQDEHGRPIAAAIVASHRDDAIDAVDLTTLPHATSDAGGNFAIDLDPRGQLFALLAWAPGHSPEVASPLLPDQQVSITLQPARTLAGTVCDLDGQPITGARVRWLGVMGRSQVEREALTRSDGTYAVHDIPSHDALWQGGFPSYWVEVTAEDYAPLFFGDGEVDRTAETTLKLDAFLTSGASLTGRVVDAETGAPLANAHVRLASSEGLLTSGRAGYPSLESPYSPRVIAATSTDADGRYVIRHAPSRGFHHAKDGGCAGTVVAWLDGYAAGHAHIEMTEDGVTSEANVIRCSPTATIHGRVVDGNGHPMASIDVTASPEARPLGGWVDVGELPWPRTRTDDEGRYTIATVAASREAPTTVTVSARIPLTDCCPTCAVEVRAGESCAVTDLVVPRQLTARLLVRDERQAPIAGAVIVDQIGFNRSPQGLRTDRDGRTSVLFPDGTLGPGQLIVRAYAYAMAATRPFTPSIAHPPELIVTLGTSHSITGRVLDTDGKPLRYVSIKVVNPATPGDDLMPRKVSEIYSHPVHAPGLPPILTYGAGHTRADGSFVVDELPPGPYVVVASRTHAESPAGPPRFDSVVARDVPTGAADLLITLPAEAPSRCGTIEARVLDAASRTPLRDLSVALVNGVERWSGSLVAPGLVRARDVTEGQWTLRIQARGFAPWEQAGIEVHAGETTTLPEIALEHGVAVRGIVRGLALLGITSASIALRSPEAADVSASATVAANGAFVVEGLRPGRYQVTLRNEAEESNPRKRTSSPRAPQAAPEALAWLAITQSTGEVTCELRAVAAARLQVHISCASLPEHEEPSTHEQRAASARSRFEIRDASGEIVHAVSGLHGRSTPHVLLPRGQYTLRVTVPGHAAVEKPIAVEPPKDVVLAIDVP